MEFNKITEQELLNKGVTGLDDTPALSTTAMQEKFDELGNLAISHHNALVDDLNAKLPNLTGTVTEIIDDDTKIPTAGAIVDYVQYMGGGDMAKSIYDQNDNGIVDDAEKLGGELPSYYQKSTDNNLNTEDKTTTGAINELENRKTVNYGTCTDYDDTSTYALGEYVIYDNKLYKCTTAITTGEVFDSTKWSAISDSKNGIVYNTTDLSFYGVRGADSVLKKLGRSIVTLTQVPTSIRPSYAGSAISNIDNGIILDVTDFTSLNITAMSGNVWAIQGITSGGVATTLASGSLQNYVSATYDITNYKTLKIISYSADGSATSLPVMSGILS